LKDPTKIQFILLGPKPSRHRWLVVGGIRGTNALKMAHATQQVSIKWIAALCRLVSQLCSTVL